MPLAVELLSLLICIMTYFDIKSPLADECVSAGIAVFNRSTDFARYSERRPKSTRFSPIRGELLAFRNPQ